MTVTARPYARRKPPVGSVAIEPTPVAAALPASGAGHLVRVLGIPFVLGASFFALAIGLGAEWPMIPAVIFGPILLIAALIFVMLTADANSTD